MADDTKVVVPGGADDVFGRAGGRTVTPPGLDDVFGPPPPPPQPPAPGMLERAGKAVMSLADALPRSEPVQPREQRRGGTVAEAKPYVAGTPRVAAPPPAEPPSQPSVLDKVPGSTGKGTPFDESLLELASGYSIRPGAEDSVKEKMRRLGQPIPGERASPGAEMRPVGETVVDKVAGAVGSVSPAAGRAARSVADAEVSLGRVLPQTAKLAADIVQLTTLGWSKPFSDAMRVWDEGLGGMQSTQHHEALARFQAMLQDPHISTGQVTEFLLQHPEFTVNTAIPSAGSMLVGMGGAKVGQQVAVRAAERAGLVGEELAVAAKKGAELGANVTNATMNAADNFDSTQASLAQRILSAAGAFGGTLAVGRLTEGGAEARAAAGARRISQNPVANAAGHAIASGAKEGVQEFGEQVSQDASQQLAEKGQLDPGAIGKNAATAAIQGVVLGGPAGVGTASHGIAMDGIHSAIDTAAAKHGLLPQATAALRDAVVGMEPDQAVAFVERALGGFERRSLVKRAGAITTFKDAALAAQQPAEAPSGAAPSDASAAATPAGAAPSAEAGPISADELLGTPVDQAAHAAATSPTNDRPEPTQAQKEAGNYKLGHIKVGGLDISVENPAGSVRRGVDKDGTPWESTLQHHYGYVKGTLAGDGDHSDVFVKPGTPEDYSGPVFVVDQIDPSTGKFDEHKSIIGASSADEATAIYQANYAPGWKGLAAITQLPLDAFRSWVKDGTKRKPLGDITGARDGLGGNADVERVGSGGPAVTSARRGTGPLVQSELQGRRAAGPSGLAVPGSVQRVAAVQPGRDEGSAALRQPTTFKTEKGSTYVLDGQSTTRNKAARDLPGHEGDSGIKKASARTVYFDKSAAALSGAGMANLGSKGSRLVIKDGKASFLTWNDKAGRWGAAPSARDIPFHAEPAVGRFPLELWSAQHDVPGHEAYSSQHAGNRIVEIDQPAAPAARAQPAVILGRSVTEMQTGQLLRYARQPAASDRVRQAAAAEVRRREEEAVYREREARKAAELDAIATETVDQSVAQAVAQSNAAEIDTPTAMAEAFRRAAAKANGSPDSANTTGGAHEISHDATNVEKAPDAARGSRSDLPAAAPGRKERSHAHSEEVAEAAAGPHAAQAPDAGSTAPASAGGEGLGVSAERPAAAEAAGVEPAKPASDRAALIEMRKRVSVLQALKRCLQ